MALMPNNFKVRRHRASTRGSTDRSHQGLSIDTRLVAVAQLVLKNFWKNHKNTYILKGMWPLLPHAWFLFTFQMLTWNLHLYGAKLATIRVLE